MNLGLIWTVILHFVIAGLSEEGMSENKDFFGVRENVSLINLNFILIISLLLGKMVLVFAL